MASPSTVLTLGYGGTPSDVLLLGYGVGAAVVPEVSDRLGYLDRPPRRRKGLVARGWATARVSAPAAVVVARYVPAALTRTAGVTAGVAAPRAAVRPSRLRAAGVVAVAFVATAHALASRLFQGAVIATVAAPAADTRPLRARWHAPQPAANAVRARRRREEALLLGLAPDEEALLL